SGRAFTLEYDCTLLNRGVHTIGPIRVRATDVFGCWKREFFFGTTSRITAFPKVHSLYESANLLQGYVGLSDEREQFDTIREYQRGDALRDVNWKQSAKRNGDLVVTEFAGEGASTRVTIAVDPSGPRVDSTAEAAASVAVHLLDAGLRVGLVTPDSRVKPATGENQRRRILSTLARLDRGTLSQSREEEGEILIRAPQRGEHVSIGVGALESLQRFGELVEGTRGEVTA
ncbi:MAG: DUF58 domain-containing protein, partial [Halobacteriaceae archaeon]